MKNEKDLSYNELHNKIVEITEKCFQPINDWSPTDWGCATSGETGELCNLLKKRLRGDIIPDEDIKREMADVILYIHLLAERMNFDLKDCVRLKFNEIAQKKGSDLRL